MKMNKKVLKISGGILVAGGIFTAGLFSQQIKTLATTDWETNAINKSQSDLRQQAYDKANTLSNQANADINAKVDAAVSDQLKAKQDELNTLMEQYYQMKLNGMTDTQQFKDLTDQINKIQAWALDQFKYQIDQTFAAQTNGQ